MLKNLPNIILILCDTLGAKHMSLYGYERKTTPNLEKLVEREGWAVYTRCFAPASWTPPSHVSLFTGLYPSEHGTHGGNFFLNPGLNTIAILLQQVGYFTVALSNNNMVSRFFKFDTGFSQFWEMWHLFPLDRFDEINKKIKNLNSRKKRLLKVLSSFLQTKEDKYIKFLINSLCIKIYKLLWRKNYSVVWDTTPFTKKTFKQLSKLIPSISKPYFIFVNLMQTHGKYNPPSLYRGKFSASLEHPNFKKMYQSEEIWFEYYLKNPDWQDYLEYLKALYDEEILFLDDILAKFIQFLKTQKEYDNTTIIITSDHGELFGEHGHVHHVFTTYNELTHVPLLIKYPKDYNIKGEINNLTQLHDLYSTFFDLANIPFPAPISSKSLLSNEKRKIAISQLIDVNFKIKGLKKRNPNFVPMDFMQPLMSIITEDFWKITKRLDGHIEVYNLNNDLYETRDLSNDNHYSKKITKLKELINLLEKATGFDKAAVKPIK